MRINRSAICTIMYIYFVPNAQPTQTHTSIWCVCVFWVPRQITIIHIYVRHLDEIPPIYCRSITHIFATHRDGLFRLSLSLSLNRRCVYLMFGTQYPANGVCVCMCVLLCPWKLCIHFRQMREQMVIFGTKRKSLSIWSSWHDVICVHRLRTWSRWWSDWPCFM